MWDDDNDQLAIPPSVDLDVGDQEGSDAVGESVGQSFFVPQRLSDPYNVFRLVLHPDDNRPARRVGKRHHSPDNGMKGAAVLFELKRLALIPRKKPLNHRNVSSLPRTHVIMGHLAGQIHPVPELAYPRALANSGRIAA